MEISLLLKHLGNLRAADVSMLRTFVRYPRVSNHSYATGYFQALISHEQISWDVYHYFLALLGQVHDNAEVRRTVMKELDTWQQNLG